MAETNSRFKRIVDILSGLAVICTLIFIALQWYEMHSGSQDTHDLAVAAKAQADSSKDTLAEIRKETTDTHDLAVAAKAQADAAKAQAAALNASVREAHSLAQARTKIQRECSQRRQALDWCCCLCCPAVRSRQRR